MMIAQNTNELLSQPMPWGEFQRLILRDTKSGITAADLPARFLMATGLMGVFDEMLPAIDINNHETIEADKLKRWGVFTGKIEADDEVGRALIRDKTGTKILVHDRNQGTSIKTANGIKLIRDLHPDEIGDVHTHPGLGANLVEEAQPSSLDLISILAGARVIMILVTPFVVSTVIRTSETNNIPRADVAKQYLEAMGKAKNRLMTGKDEKTGDDLDSVWQVDTESLGELGIAFYQARRGDKISNRKK